MALIKCPECGKNVSNQAEACIHCGYPLKKVAVNDAETPGQEFSEATSSQELQTTQEMNLALEAAADAADAVPARISDKKKRRFIVFGALLACVIVAGVLLYAFYYRPHYVPESVEDAAYSIYVNGKSTTCSFTGTLLDDIPQGIGHYCFTDKNGQWTYDGTLDEDSAFSTGTAKNMPVTIPTYLSDFQASYTGYILGGEMTDPLQVTDMPFRIEYDGKQYDGLYTGAVRQNEPDGSGTFKFETRDRFFDYSGNWSNGELSGGATLYSNDVTVHFTEQDRTGTYDGEVVDGVLCGQGTFSATTDDGTDYTYKGEWENGLWNGQGMLVYDSGDFRNRIGCFTAGDFTPTVLEYFTSYGTREGDSYTISAPAQTFIEEHEALFTANSDGGIQGYVDSDFSYTLFAKSPANYGNHLFKVTGLYVFQVFENDNYWGYSSTAFLAYDRNYNVYSGVLLATSDKIVENRRVTLYALPLAFSTYEGVDGYDHWSLQFAAVYVE